MKIAIIAEKPSVAREIASIVGANQKKDGYIEGNNYLVTWAFGHLIGLAMPEDYGHENWSRTSLPVIPNSFILKPRQVKAEKSYKVDMGALKQLEIIKQIFNRSDKIIVATDAGREGELIFRYIYNYLLCDKPFERLWISSLTEKAIKEGLQNLKAGSDYDNLFFSAKARSESDWLIGINATQAITIAAGSGVYSLGRVQTPTLNMICKRYLENKNFVPVPYFQIKLQLHKGDIPFEALTVEKFENKELAEKTLQMLYNQKLVVQSVECKEVIQNPPLLYDLTTLQKEANNKHGFSADKTLSIAQKLYETKLITYPRTGSRYLSDDVFETIPNLISGLHSHPKFGSCAKNLTSLNSRSVNTNKVTDHHAIIITDHFTELAGDEKMVYDMVLARLLEAFSAPCLKDITTVILVSQNVQFSLKGAVIKQYGWRGILNETEDKEDENSKVLPPISENGMLDIDNLELLEKQTKAKSLHTEASLLSAMENAGKELENEEERDAMKESGIGTPATRASIIETLFARSYVIRDKKSLVPTEKGLAVFDVIKDMKISDVAMTGSWENALAKIERGTMDIETFKKAIEIHTRQITEELLNVKISVSGSSVLCPKCKLKNLTFFPKVVKCDCGFLVFKNKSGKNLSDSQIIDLVTKGKTGTIKGFKSKEGKLFDAVLAMNEEYNISFVFSNKKAKK